MLKDQYSSSLILKICGPNSLCRSGISHGCEPLTNGFKAYSILYVYQAHLPSKYFSVAVV